MRAIAQMGWARGLILLVCAVACGHLWGATAVGAQEKPVLVVYDFTSAFDQGKTGRWVAEMVRGHAKRADMYAMVDPITFSDLMAQSKAAVTHESDPAAVGKLTREAFDGEFFIYGRVTRKGPDGYVLDFRIYRTGAEGDERILEESRDCPGKEFVSGAVDEVLKKLAGVGDPIQEWRKLGGSLRDFAARWQAAADDDREGFAKALADWARELSAAERNLTSYRLRERAHRQILDQFQAFAAQVKDLAAALTHDPESARPSVPPLLARARQLSRNILAWTDDTSVEERWKTGKNLVANGDFTYGQDGPANWDPLPAGIIWVARPGARDPRDKCIRMDVTREVAETAGAIYYSQAFDIEEGATYRFSVAVKTEGPSPKVFIKTYADFAAAAGFDAQSREVYRAPLHVKVPPIDRTGWHTYTRDFVPYTGNENRPRSCRVMLYAYLQPGVIYWDDVAIKKIKDAPVSLTGGAQ